MRVFIFSFWYVPDNRTAVNRIANFKKKFLEIESEVHLIYSDGGVNEYPQDLSSYKIPHVHLVYKLSRYLLKKQWHFLYKVIHFFYLVFRKRDVYDFYLNYKSIEADKAYSFHKNDIVITSAPPYSALNIGYYLKSKYGLKWVIDYRDPWTLGYSTLGFSRLANNLRKLTQRNEELKFLDIADDIITVSESLKSTFPEKYQHKIHVIENGANTDEMDLNKINSSPQTFSIVYAGTLHPQQFENIYFFGVLKKIITDLHIEPEDLKLHFIGADDSAELKAEIHKYNLEAYVNITARVELPVLYEFMYEASLFLQLKYADRDKIITSKQADYLALQKPILLPESDHGDLAESIFKNKAGYVCNNKDELYFTLQQEYVRFINHENIRIERDENFMKGISRNEASEKLLRLIYADLPLTETLKNEMELINRFYE